MESKEYYSVKEASKRLKVSESEIRRLVFSGELKFAVPVKSVEMFAFTRCVDVVGMKPDGNTDNANWVDISKWWGCHSDSALYFVDLFCGAGGMSRGFEKAGMHGVCGMDFNGQPEETYTMNFSHPFVHTTDVDGFVRFISGMDCASDTDRLVVSGGFPLNGFSVDDFGCLRGTNANHEFMKSVVGLLMPGFFVCVCGVGSKKGVAWKAVEKMASDYYGMGYRVDTAVLCAADYLVPQKRKCIVMIGNRNGVVNYHPSPLVGPDGYRTVGDAIGDLVDYHEDVHFSHIFSSHTDEMKKKIAECPEGSSLYRSYSSSWRKCPWDEPSRAVRDNHGGVNLHPKLPRVMTPRELARLQSFPDDFIFYGNKNRQLVQIGNAVPCLLGKAIGLSVRYSAGDIR